MRALITGAAHGLGRALTEALLNTGYEVVAVDRDTDPLDQLVVDSRGACSVQLVDLANPGSVDRFLTRIDGAQFDLIVLNAGVSATGRFEDIPSAAYAKLIEINLKSPLTMAAFFMKKDLIAKRGKLVFISSLSHELGYPGASVYGATKDAIAIYAKSLRKPAKKSGFGVLTVFPGPIRTEHAERHAPAGAKAEKRMDPDKLANMILKTAKSKKRELYPGTAAAFSKWFGQLAPKAATKLMRKMIFEKLDNPTY